MSEIPENIIKRTLHNQEGKKLNKKQMINLIIENTDFGDQEDEKTINAEINYLDKMDTSYLISTLNDLYPELLDDDYDDDDYDDDDYDDDNDDDDDIFKLEDEAGPYILLVTNYCDEEHFYTIDEFYEMTGKSEKILFSHLKRPELEKKCLDYINDNKDGVSVWLYFLDNEQGYQLFSIAPKIKGNQLKKTLKDNINNITGEYGESYPLETGDVQYWKDNQDEVHLSSLDRYLEAFSVKTVVLNKDGKPKMSTITTIENGDKV